MTNQVSGALPTKLNELMMYVLNRLAQGADFNQVMEETGITARVSEAIASKEPRVLVVVSGGVADPVYDSGVDVYVFDRDDHNDDPEGTGGVPTRFADLAERCDIPVEHCQQTVPESPAA